LVISPEISTAASLIDTSARPGASPAPLGWTKTPSVGFWARAVLAGGAPAGGPEEGGIVGGSTASHPRWVAKSSVSTL